MARGSSCIAGAPYRRSYWRLCSNCSPRPRLRARFAPTVPRCTCAATESRGGEGARARCFRRRLHIRSACQRRWIPLRSRRTDKPSSATSSRCRIRCGNAPTGRTTSQSPGSICGAHRHDRADRRLPDVWLTARSLYRSLHRASLALQLSAQTYSTSLSGTHFSQAVLSVSGLPELYSARVAAVRASLPQCCIGVLRLGSANRWFAGAPSERFDTRSLAPALTKTLVAFCLDVTFAMTVVLVPIRTFALVLARSGAEGVLMRRYRVAAEGGFAGTRIDLAVILESGRFVVATSCRKNRTHCSHQQQ